MGLGKHLAGGHRHTHGHRPGSADEPHDHHHGMGVIHRAGAYDLFTRLTLAGRRGRVYAALARATGARPGERALDLGCGTGALTTALGAAVGPTGRVVGIDPSPEMVAFAQRQAPAQVSYAVHPAEALPFGAGEFDVVASALAVHHIDAASRPVALAEAARVLRPGGRLLLADFQPPRGRLARTMIRALTGPGMADNDPVPQLRELCAGAGLQVIGQGRQAPVFAWVLAVKD